MKIFMKHLVNIIFMKDVYLIGENIKIYAQFVGKLYLFQIIIIFTMKLHVFINQLYNIFNYLIQLKINI